MARDGPIIVLVTSLAVIGRTAVLEAVRIGHPDNVHATALVFVKARYPPTVPAAAELRTMEIARCTPVHAADAVGDVDAPAYVDDGMLGVTVDEAPGAATLPQPASAIVASAAETTDAIARCRPRREPRAHGSGALYRSVAVDRSVYHKPTLAAEGDAEDGRSRGAVRRAVMEPEYVMTAFSHMLFVGRGAS